MPMSKRSKIFIALGSLITLGALLAFGNGLMHFNPDLRQHYCHPQVKKCNGSHHLYHLETEQCLRAGVAKGALCGKNMVMLPSQACPIQGICECDYKNNERHLVYENATDQCYSIYSKGPCHEGYVVTISSKRQILQCTPDSCAEDKSKVSVAQRDLIVPYGQKCHALYSTLDEPGCKGPLKFWKNQIDPSCSPPATYQTGSSLLSSVPLHCHPGSFQIAEGHCHPTSHFKIGVPSPPTYESDELSR